MDVWFVASLLCVAIRYGYEKLMIARSKALFKKQYSALTNRTTNPKRQLRV